MEMPLSGDTGLSDGKAGRSERGVGPERRHQPKVTRGAFVLDLPPSHRAAYAALNPSPPWTFMSPMVKLPWAT